jgi:hypothetical protein
MILFNHIRNPLILAVSAYYSVEAKLEDMAGMRGISPLRKYEAQEYFQDKKLIIDKFI